MIKANGLAEERAKQASEHPLAALRRYAQYFERYEGVKVANICGSCGEKRFSRLSDAPAGEWKTWKETLSMLDKPPKGWYNYLCCISTRSAVG